MDAEHHRHGCRPTEARCLRTKHRLDGAHSRFRRHPCGRQDAGRKRHGCRPTHLSGWRTLRHCCLYQIAQAVYAARGETLPKAVASTPEVIARKRAGRLDAAVTEPANLPGTGAALAEPAAVRIKNRTTSQHTARKQTAQSATVPNGDATQTAAVIVAADKSPSQSPQPAQRLPPPVSYIISSTIRHVSDVADATLVNWLRKHSRGVSRDCSVFLSSAERCQSGLHAR